MVVVLHYDTHSLEASSLVSITLSSTRLLFVSIFQKICLACVQKLCAAVMVQLLLFRLLTIHNHCLTLLTTGCQ
ncbi:hypothetical protein AQUCO_04700058v1 [Aquilegia coerulea]|uniref:Uncharacterized protein n=1 Tax=Aquilegia coerulea TaxID=218851 RepID=A0A2G5CKX9_AQUCA|nr:hypothetical protein AQUCO_04700058v1 [Aquilegia coerulea]